MGSNRKWALGAALFLVACGGGNAPAGGDQKIISVQQNSSPTGFISGRVLDSANGKPVTGVLVTTFAEGPVLTSTDINGLYRLGPIPAGSYTVSFEAPGFLKRTTAAEIQTVGSMFPVGNTVVTKDMDLSRGDATIEGQVLTNTGQFGKGATLYVDLRSAGFDLVASTTADMNGKFKFTGMPGAAFGQSVIVQIAPFDENSDGIPDYSSSQRFFALFPGATTYNTITLFALGVQLVTSNISDADLLPSEAITLSFSGQIKLNQSTITLFRNSGSVQVGATLEWDMAGTTATLTPVGGNLVEGQSYYVLYNVRSISGATTTSSINFIARPALGPPPLGTVANFRVISPATTDSALTSVSLGWDSLANAGGYRIYGKDSAMASAYLLLSTVASGASTTATVSLTLFDSVAGDAFSTPLGHHNKVTLAIVATDRVGNETSFMTAATIQLADKVNPTVFTAVQSAGSANNLAGGTAATVQYQVTFSELMATDAMPQITLPNAGTSAVFNWTGPKGGTFVITVPAGVDGRGTLSINASHDTSDNVQAVALDAALM
jgi:hypothetical protein